MHKVEIFDTIVKRNGKKVSFDPEKITQAIQKAGQATGEFDESVAKKLSLRVLSLAQQLYSERETEFFSHYKFQWRSILVFSRNRHTVFPGSGSSESETAL